MTIWTEGEIQSAIKLLGKVARPDYACSELSTQFGRVVTVDALGKAFRRRQLGVPSAFCAQRFVANDAPANDTAPPTSRATAAEPEPVEVAPMPVLRQLPATPGARGKRYKVAVLSDTHLGSKYILRDELRSFVSDCYDRGVREFLHSGDILEGIYDHANWERSHAGFDDQLRDLFETWPSLPGARIHCIAGNHDETFFKAAGMDPGKHLENWFAANGRPGEFYTYGMRDARLKIHGAVFNLYHPSGGGSTNAHLNRLVAKVNWYPPGEHVDVLIAGHWHDFAHLEHRGTQVITAPTFQGSGGPFGNTLVRKPSIGGLILEWSKDEHGHMREFSVERRIVRESTSVHVVNA